MWPNEIIVSAQGPLILGFGAKGLGPGRDNKTFNDDTRQQPQLPRVGVALFVFLWGEELHLLPGIRELRAGAGGGLTERRGLAFVTHLQSLAKIKSGYLCFSFMEIGIRDGYKMSYK